MATEDIVRISDEVAGKFPSSRRTLSIARQQLAGGGNVERILNALAASEPKDRQAIMALKNRLAQEGQFAEDKAAAESTDENQLAQDWFGKLPEEERSRIIESSGFTGGPGILPVEAVMAAWKASQGATAHAERGFASFSETGLGLNSNRPGFAKSRLQ